MPNLRPEYGDIKPAEAPAVEPRWSQIDSVYEPCANAGWLGIWAHSQGFQTIWVALPAMVLYVPLVGPTGYVLPLSVHVATRVRDWGMELGERERERSAGGHGRGGGFGGRVWSQSRQLCVCNDDDKQPSLVPTNTTNTPDTSDTPRTDTHRTLVMFHLNVI